MFIYSAYVTNTEVVARLQGQPTQARACHVYHASRRDHTAILPLSTFSDLKCACVSHSICHQPLPNLFYRMQRGILLARLPAAA